MMTAETALKVAMAAKARGVNVFIESVLPHFLLDKTYAEREGVEGMKHVMSPPLRDKKNLHALWNGLSAGFIDTVGTDHCPFDVEQKRSHCLAGLAPLRLELDDDRILRTFHGLDEGGVSYGSHLRFTLAKMFATFSKPRLPK